MCIRAIGDTARDMALDALDKALTANPRDDHRHRIEHLGNWMITPERLARITMWRDFIRKSVARAVADYLATNKPGSRTRSERPTAPLNTAPATQVVPPSTAAVEGAKLY